MRLVAIILGLFLIGASTALWFALSPGADRAALPSGDLARADLSGASSEELADPGPDAGPALPLPPPEAPSDLATASTAPLPTPEQPPSEGSGDPAPEPVTPEPPRPAPAAPEAAEPARPAAPSSCAGTTLSVPGLTPDDPPSATAAAPAPATPPSATAAAPEPRDPLPAEPVAPAEALAAIAPELATPAAPPVRRLRPAEPPQAASGSDLPAGSPAAAPPAPGDEALPSAPAAPPVRRAAGPPEAPSPRAADAAAAAPPEPPAPPAAPDTRRVAGDRVNLREGPGTDTAALETLSLDEEVEVLETRGDWVRIRTATGTEGWVAARFLAN